MKLPVLISGLIVSLALVSCSAYYVSEEGESPDYSYVEYSGYVEITGQDNGLVWTFVVEEEVTL
jgi:hypothetical protein